MLDLRDKTTGLIALGFAACLGLTAFVYWPGLADYFVLDDAPNILQVYDPAGGWSYVVYTITHNGSGLLGRVVSMLSFMFSGYTYGLDAAGYKFHNLLLHLLNGVLLFRLLQNLLPLLDRQLDSRTPLLIAAACAGLWLLHPLLVSTVLYVVQRMTELAALFTLLALLAYLKARAVIATRQFWFYGWFVLPLMCLLAVLSKENGVLVILYMAAIEVLAYRTQWSDLRRNRRLCVFLVTFIALPLLLAGVVLALFFDSILNYSNRTFTMGERLLTQLHVLFFYAQQILFPRLRTMSLFLDDYPVTTGLDAVTVLLLLLLGGVVFLVWKLRRTWPVLAFGLVWFLVSHVLESTFLPLELAFEHRNYLASAGLLLLPVYGVFKTTAYRPLRLLCPVFVGIFAFMTATRAKEWGDYDLFHRLAVIEHPESGRALNTYINYLTGLGEYDQTIEQLEKLLGMTPNELGAILHMQVVKCIDGQRDDAVLARALDVAARYPASVYAHSALQTFVINIVDGKCGDLTVADAEPIINAAMDAPANSRDPNYSDFLRLRAIIEMNQGRYARGYSDFRVAHEMNGQITTLYELIRFQLVVGRLGDAEETLALMAEQNARRFGTETYMVEKSRTLIEAAKRTTLQ